MWHPGCSLLPRALVVFAVLSCPTDGSSLECKGDSCAAEDLTDETSLMHLTATVKKGGKKEGTLTEAAAEAIVSKPRPAELSLPDGPVFGPALLQLKASSLSAHTDHKTATATGEGNLEMVSSATEFASASETHFLAYVVLVGIVVVLCGVGLVVLIGMKGEDDGEDYLGKYKQFPDYSQPQTEGFHSSVYSNQPQSASMPPGANRTLPTAVPASGSQSQLPPRPASGPTSSAMQNGSDPMNSGGLFRGGNAPRSSPIQSNQGAAAARPGQPGNAAPNANILCPNLKNAVVPPRTTFKLKVPMLLHQISEEYESAKNRTVELSDGTCMFNMEITERKPLPHETNHPLEYIKLSLPGETKDLILICLGKPENSVKVECHVYQYGKDPWGIIRDDPNEPGAYTIFPRHNSNPILTAKVQKDPEGKRRVRVTPYGAGQEGLDAAVAVQAGDGADAYYQVDAYPGCDISLAVVMILGVDRVTAHNRS